MDLNHVVIAGRLTKDPDLKYTPNGVAVSSITVAVNRSFTNAQGNREADFIPCITWRKTAELIAEHFRKGDEIGGVGRVQTRSYENSEGKKVFVTELVLESFSFGQKKNGTRSGDGNTSGSNQNANTGQNRSNNSYSDPFASDGKPIDINDDDLPF